MRGSTSAPFVAPLRETVTSPPDVSVDDVITTGGRKREWVPVPAALYQELLPLIAQVRPDIAAAVAAELQRRHDVEAAKLEVRKARNRAYKQAKRAIRVVTPAA